MQFLPSILSCLWLIPVHGAASLGANVAVGHQHQCVSASCDSNYTSVDRLRRDKVVEIKEKLILTGDMFSKHMRILARDDPESAPALRELISEITAIDESTTTLEEMKQFGMKVLAQATTQCANQAVQVLSKSDWVEVYGRRDTILWSLTQAGKLSAEEASLYRSDDDAWKEELFAIWDAIHEDSTLITVYG